LQGKLRDAQQREHRGDAKKTVDYAIAIIAMWHRHHVGQMHGDEQQQRQGRE
jgi:hypothetical protein